MIVILQKKLDLFCLLFNCFPFNLIVLFIHTLKENKCDNVVNLFIIEIGMFNLIDQINNKSLNLTIYSYT